jgi:hypothetical protein
MLGWLRFRWLKRSAIHRTGAALRRWLRRVMPRRRSNHTGAARYEGQRRTALRLVWEIGAEFSDQGWGRRDLDALRLLCLNLRPGQVVGPRIAERFRKLLPPLLSNSADRIAGLVDAGRLLPVDPQTLLEIENGLEDLLSPLEGVAFQAGQPLPFNPHEVVGAIDRILHACQSVRFELEPLVTCEPAAVARRVAERAHAARLATGELLLDAIRAHGSMVAIEPSDMSECLEALMAALFHGPRRLSPVRLSVQPADEALCLSFSWAIDDRVQLDPSLLIRPLRALAAYGVHHALDEDLELRTRKLCAWLPLANRVTNPQRAAARY